MKAVARFEKVSYNQFLQDYKDTFGFDEDKIKEIYDNIKMPKRATVGSAGYDFYAPIDIKLNPGETAKIPTGIRAYIEPGYVLEIYPRSGLGFKYRLQLNNTVGIIDADYYNSKNEGHIFIKITNDSNEGKSLSVPAGDGFSQGIFKEFFVTYDDDTNGIRDGGFGSTTKKENK
jgi:dUTP pyrophosphatase